MLLQAARAVLDALQRHRAQTGARIKLPATMYGHRTAEGILSEALGGFATARSAARVVRHNPELRPRGRRVIYPQVVAVIAQKRRGGPEYIHEFSTRVRAVGLPDGRAVIEGEGPVWGVA